MNSYSSNNSGLPPLPGPSPLIGQTVKTTTTSTSTIKPSIEMPNNMKDSGNTFNFIVLPLVAIIFALLGFIAGSLVTSNLTGSKTTTPIINNPVVSYPVSTPVSSTSFETKAYTYNGNTVWTVYQPTGWQANEGGLLEGFLTMSGKYNSNTYSLTFSYPIFNNQGEIPASLQAWVDSAISALGSSGMNVQTQNIKVDNVDAIEVLGIPTTGENQDAVYIWSHGSKNPSLIIINFVSGTFDAAEMQYILETVVGGTKLATT